jgi:antitoxin (DNA-binding transcriptional repressor) of toxin-antitoxin stability system
MADLYQFELERYAVDDDHRGLQIYSTASWDESPNEPGLRTAQLYAAGILGRLGMLLADEIAMVAQDHGCTQPRRRYTQRDLDQHLGEYVGQVSPGGECSITAWEIGAVGSLGHWAYDHGRPSLAVVVPASEVKRIRALMIRTLNELEADKASEPAPDDSGTGSR